MQEQAGLSSSSSSSSSFIITPKQHNI